MGATAPAGAPEQPGGATPDDGSSRWQLAISVVGAAAGIGAWIAVVGGARIWARLHAAHIPAAETVSDLPRQLLIAEGFRTLLVPLLLATAIAVLTYLSRAESPRLTPDEADDADDEPPPLDEALAQSRRALAHIRAARDAVKAARDAATLYGGAGEDAAANAMSGAFRRSVGTATASIAEARRRAMDAERRVDTTMQVAEHAKSEVGHHLVAIAQIHASIAKLDAAARTLHECLQAATPEDREQTASRWAEELGAAADALADARKEMKAAHSSIADARRAGAREGIERLFASMGRLAPVTYLRRWWLRLDRDFGIAITLLVVLLLVLIFTAIGLVLLRADPGVLIVTTVVLGVAGLILALVRRELVPVMIPVALVVIPAAGLWSSLRDLWPLLVVAVTFGTIWVSLGAMAHWGTAPGIAWILFVAIAFWSGALAFIGELGAKEVPMDAVVVQRKSVSGLIAGYYLGRTSKQIYLASADKCGSTDCRRVLSVSTSDVTCVAFGPQYNVRESQTIDRDLTAFRAPKAKGDPCTTPPPKASSSPSTYPVPTPYPEPYPVPTSSESSSELVLDSNVLFRFGSARLTPAATGPLRAAAQAIRAAHARVVYIAGHTDSEGSTARNATLSEQRAEAVRDALIKELAPDRPSITARGYGETKPLACNARRDGSDDPVARAYNRRVEVWTGQPPRYPALRCSR